MSKDENNNRKSKFALGAILGGIAGVLFAPKKGSDTREDIKAEAKKAKVEAETQATRARRQAEVTAKQFKQTSSRVAGKAKKAFYAGKDAAASELKGTKEDIQGLKETPKPDDK